MTEDTKRLRKGKGKQVRVVIYITHETSKSTSHTPSGPPGRSDMIKNKNQDQGCLAGSVS